MLCGVLQMALCLCTGVGWVDHSSSLALMACNQADDLHRHAHQAKLASRVNDFAQLDAT